MKIKGKFYQTNNNHHHPPTHKKKTTHHTAIPSSTNTILPPSPTHQQQSQYPQQSTGNQIKFRPQLLPQSHNPDPTHLTSPHPSYHEPRPKAPSKGHQVLAQSSNQKNHYQKNPQGKEIPPYQVPKAFIYRSYPYPYLH